MVMSSFSEMDLSKKYLTRKEADLPAPMIKILRILIRDSYFYC
jgi:hypothetical protein